MPEGSEPPLSPLQGYPGGESAYKAEKPLDAFIEEMIHYRSAICHEHAITTDHNHCIGCTLVMDFMQKHHSKMQYGTREQWEMESAFCVAHERDIIKEFIRQKGEAGVRIQTSQD